MKNKRGDKIISIYWFAILFIVAAAIVYMAAIFYGAPYDVRGIEAGILTDKIADCLSQGGYLKENILGDESFKDNFLEECNLNFNIEEKYGWEEQGQYYTEINFYEFNQDSPEAFGKEVFGIVKGNINLKTSFMLERAEKERKTKRKIDTVVIHYTAGISARGAINTMKEDRLSIHYMIDRNGLVISEANAGEIVSGGDKVFKSENEKAAHAGCYNTRVENGRGKWRPKCSEISPECVSPTDLLKEECKSYLSNILEEKKCCIRNYNERSIGIELVNLGNMCEATTGYCKWNGGTCKSICKDKGKGIKINEAVWEGFTDEQLNSLVDLVSGIASRQGIPLDRAHIIGHDEITNFKSDPGPAFPWNDFMTKLKAKEKLSPSIGRSFYVLDKDGNKYVIQILAIVGKNEKNV